MTQSAAESPSYRVRGVYHISDRLIAFSLAYEGYKLICENVMMVVVNEEEEEGAMVCVPSTALHAVAWTELNLSGEKGREGEAGRTLLYLLDERASTGHSGRTFEEVPFVESSPRPKSQCMQTAQS